MQIKENEKLSPYTTFKIGGPASFFCVVKNERDLREAVKFSRVKKLPVLFLGGGSNVLISDKGFEGLAVLMDIKGLEVKDNADYVILKAAAGEIWDNVVALSVNSNWWGIENLSHIPGATGAVAVQNVGAYGQEASQVVKQVTAFDLKTGRVRNFNNQDCEFSYRSSIFNGKEKGRYAILWTYFKLSKQPRPNLRYRDLNLLFAGKHPTLAEIRQAVINIRDKKFPFPRAAKNGNAGSFFKNLILTANEYNGLKNKIVKALGKGPAENLRGKIINAGDKVKLPTAFLLDICGIKDVAGKNVKINFNQPLVIVNATGKATADDVLGLAKRVIKTVMDKTGLWLNVEPELIGFTDGELTGIIK